MVRWWAGQQVIALMRQVSSGMGASKGDACPRGGGGRGAGSRARVGAHALHRRGDTSAGSRSGFVVDGCEVDGAYCWWCNFSFWNRKQLCPLKDPGVRVGLIEFIQIQYTCKVLEMLPSSWTWIWLVLSWDMPLFSPAFCSFSWPFLTRSKLLYFMVTDWLLWTKTIMCSETQSLGVWGLFVWDFGGDYKSWFRWLDTLRRLLRSHNAEPA